MSDSLYTKEVRNLFKSLRWPKGLQVVVAEEEFNLNCVMFIENFKSLDGEDQQQAAGVLKEFMEKVRGMGIPIYMQLAEGDGRRDTQHRVRLAD